MQNYNKIYILTLFFTLTSFFTFAQENLVKGKVVNAKTGEPLAFVNLIASNSGKGCSTDIDGKFSLKQNEPIISLKLSYVGFETKVVTITGNKNDLIIRLQEKQLELKEVVIVAGENPAHRIIRNVMENRDLNNPEKQHSFSYTSYNKLIFTSKTDSIVVKNNIVKDSTAIKMKAYFEKQHLLMMESVTKRKFLQPDKNFEEVIASRISGFKNPIFTFIGSQLQSFSFYNERFNIFEKYYINPISNGCTGKYYFQLEDTLYADNKTDTTFIISYRPKNNTNFEGLKGLLYINTFHWAIENATAEPAIPQKQGLNINIQQKYELIDGKQWFPVQLNTDLSFTMDNLPYPLIANARAYLKEILLSPDIPKKTFSNIELEIKDSAGLQPEIYWNLHRIDSLTNKELKTYHVIDSLGNKYNFEKKLNIIQALMDNKIPWGIINLDIDKFISFNEYEKFRLGLGIHTSQKLSERFTVGAYWGYSFGDKVPKYGGDASLYFYKPWDLKCMITYSNDIRESGSSVFYNEKKSFFEGNYKDFFAKDFDKTEQSSIAIGFRTFRYMQLKIALEKRICSSLYNYEFVLQKENFSLLPEQFNYTDIQLGLRYAYKEKYMKVRNKLIAFPTKYPVVWINFTKGIRDFLDGEYNYRKIEMKIEKNFYTNYVGKTTLIAFSGYADNNLPFSILFAGRAAYNDAYIDIPNAFNTMHYNEFATNRYASLHFRHSFGSLLFRRNNFNPEVVILTNVMIGSLDNSMSHRNITLKAPDKGYFESGICINNLLKSGFSSFGIGAYLRFGPYRFDNNADNWALKWTMTIPI
ncbi:MAG: DUF5686 family protein [Bacteroidales bacterium]